MLEDYYVKPATVDRVRASWLAPQIESYLEWLESHRYSRLVVYRRLPLLFHFAEFAQKKGCKDVASCKAYIKEFVSQWLEQHGAKAKTAIAVRKHTIDAECGVRQMLQLACKEPVMRNRRRRPFPLESEVPGFAEYLRSERGFAESTIRNYRRHLDEFAEYLSRTGITSFGQLSPAVLAAFIVQYRPKVAPRTRLGFCCHLRVLLRFCYREGITTRDLSGAVGTPQIYRLNDVPRSITWDEVRACWKRWSEGRFGDGATMRFCFFWSPMVCGGMRLQDSLWTMSTGSASDFRCWRARQGTPQSTLWRVLSQKQSSTISRMVGLRPRIVICFSAPVRRRLRLLLRLCHLVLRSIFTRRAFKYPRPDRTRFATPASNA